MHQKDRQKDRRADGWTNNLMDRQFAFNFIIIVIIADNDYYIKSYCNLSIKSLLTYRTDQFNTYIASNNICL